MLSLLEYLMFEKLENINTYHSAQVGKVFQVWKKEIQKMGQLQFYRLYISGRKQNKKLISKKFFYNNLLLKSAFKVRIPNALLLLKPAKLA